MEPAIIAFIKYKRKVLGITMKQQESVAVVKSPSHSIVIIFLSKIGNSDNELTGNEMINLWLDETINRMIRNNSVYHFSGGLYTSPPPPCQDTLDHLIRNPAVLEITHLALRPLDLEAWNVNVHRWRKSNELGLIFTFITLEHEQSVLKDGSIIPRSIIQNPIGNLFMLGTYLD